MMRPCAFLLAAALVTACGPNPAFQVTGDGGGGTGSSGESGGSTGADGSTGAAVCEPSARQSVADVCAPWQPLGITPPNLAKSPMLSGRPCDSELDIQVLRESEDRIIACPNGCASPCFSDLYVSISTAVTLPEVDPLLPEIGECARFWHTGRVAAGDPNACESTAFALWSLADRERLSLAVASVAPNPFAGVAGLDLEVTLGEATACDSSSVTDDRCPDGAQVDPLGFRLGTCEFTALQTEKWEGLQYDGLPYKLDLYRAYRCGGEVPDEYGWYLRRDP